MSHTVFANGRSVCTKGTPDTALAPSDPCLTPDGKTVYFPNEAPLAKLGKGQTTSVKAAGQPVWTEKGQLDPKTDPDHPGSAGGTKSGSYRGWCQPTSWSPNVLFEGGHVVRMFDTTTQNNGNCPGMVMPAPAAAEAAAAASKAAQEALDALRKKNSDDADDNKDADGANNEGADQSDKEPESGNETGEEECSIDWARIEDSNGRSLTDEGKLEIVPPLAGETISCTGEILKTCTEAPTWKASGNHSHEASGLSTTFRASSWNLSDGWIGDASARSTNVTFAAGPDTKSFTLLTYPADRLRLTLKVPPAITAIVKGAEVVLEAVSDTKISFDGPNLVGMIEAEWAEDSGSTEAFYKYKVRGGGSPLFGIKAKISVVPNKVLSKLIKWLGGGFYLIIEINKRLTLNFERTSPGAPQIAAEGAGRCRLALAFLYEKGSQKAVKADIGVRGTGELVAKGKKVGDVPAFQIQFTLGPLEGYLKIKVGTWFEYEKRAIIFGQKKLPSSPATIDLTQLFG